MIPSIPSEWQAVGHLPPVDLHLLDAPELKAAWFDDCTFTAVDPTGSYRIEVSWCGGFDCQIWDARRGTVKTHRAARLADVRAWLDEAFAFVRQRTLQ